MPPPLPPNYQAGEIASCQSLLDVSAEKFSLARCPFSTGSVEGGRGGGFRSIHNSINVYCLQEISLGVSVLPVLAIMVSKLQKAYTSLFLKLPPAEDIKNTPPRVCSSYILKYPLSRRLTLYAMVLREHAVHCARFNLQLPVHESPNGRDCSEKGSV